MKKNDDEKLPSRDLSIAATEPIEGGKFEMSPVSIGSSGRRLLQDTFSWFFFSLSLRSILGIVEKTKGRRKKKKEKVRTFTPSMNDSTRARVRSHRKRKEKSFPFFLLLLFVSLSLSLYTVCISHAVCKDWQISEYSKRKIPPDNRHLRAYNNRVLPKEKTYR